jgi:hypothetical protein
MQGGISDYAIMASDNRGRSLSQANGISTNVVTQ